MHLYFVTRAPKHIRDLWVANMQSQMSDWKRKNLKTGKEEIHRVQWNLKPIELWELVLPEDKVQEAMWFLGMKGSKQCHDKPLKKLAKVFRAGLNLQPLPDYDEKKLMVENNRLIYREGMSIYGLGVKADEFKEFPQWGYKQEAL